MSGGHEVGAAPPADADPSADANATQGTDAAPGAHATSTPESARAQPTDAPARVRPAHVVPGGSDAASGPGVPALVAAVHARDAAAARKALSPTFQGKANGRPMDVDAQVRLLESFWVGFPDGNFAMDPVGGSGRYVITWTFQGTHGGMYAGVPPTGTPIAFSGYIIAVADKSGVTSLDWKWDTKVFTRAVLGPDQVGDLEVKDTFRDPSKRWQQDGRGQGRGPGQARRKKGKGPGRPGQQQGGRPQGQGRPQGEPTQAGEGAQAGDGTQPGSAGTNGQPGQPGQRQRRQKKPRDPQSGQPAATIASNDPPMAPTAPNDDATASAPSASSADASGEHPRSDSETQAEPKPDGN